MPDATITSTASTFGTISGTFSSDQSTVTGTISGVVTGTLTGSVGVPGPAGPAGEGVPTGGTTGQVLAKVDGVDYNTEWVNASGGVWGTITGTLSNQTDLQTALNLKAPLASPALTGVPTAPTAATLTSTTQLATTAFVQQELAAGTAVAKNLEVYVRNQSGSTIPAGSIVYISGATGNRPLITLAQANNDANSAQTIGFVKTSIANNGFGYVIVRGELENIDTSALTEGVQLYLSPTTAGTWTTTKPSAPQHLVYVGIVIRSHPTLGVILVAVQNGYELNELHDVAISSPTNGQVLKYDSATSLWKNSLDIGIPAGGTAGQFLTKIDGTDYNTDWTTVNLSVYAVKSNNLSDLTSASTARSNLSLGTLDTPVFAGVTAQGSGSNVAYLTPTSLTLTHATSGTFTIQPSAGITFPDSTVQTTAFTTAQLTNYLAKASNLSDLASASTARTNLGLGSLAVVNDAPSDGNQYARKNGAWDVVSIPSAYITSVSSPLSVTSGNLTIDLSAYLTSATAASTYQTQAGMSSYLTTSTAASTYLTQSNAASTYQTISGMSSYLTTSAAASTYAPIASPTFTGVATFDNPGNFVINVQGSGTGYDTRIESNVYSMRNNSVEVIRIGASGIKYPDGVTQSVAYPGTATIFASPALTGNVTITTNSTGAALFIEQSGTGNILTLHDQASDTTFVAIDQNGKVGTIASTTTNAGFNVPHGTAPTTPVNGDVWTTTSGLFMRQNGSTKQYVDFDGTQTINGAKTFSNANQTLGNSTAAGTIAIGTGATVSGSTRTINIGTASAAGSTNAINIGGGSGTSTTTLNGTVNATTAAADTNSVQVATTAFVVGQAGSSTPLINGTAAVGTSLRYARADHVHPTDTSRAPLASPTFTGVPAAPTATAGTNTTQIATTAFVQQEVPAASTTAAGKVELATSDEAILGSSTTLVPSAFATKAAVMTSDWSPVYRAGFTATTSGTGAACTLGWTNTMYQMPSSGSSGHSYARTFGLNQIDQITNLWGDDANIYVNFAKRIWISGRSLINLPTQANYLCSVSFGKAEATGIGDLSQRGIGWKYTCGTSQVVQLMVHNGTTLTTVNSSFTPTSAAFSWDIVSEGNGNVTLYINGSSVATTSSGPSTRATSTQCLYQEEAVLTATSTNSYTRFYCARGAIYVQR